MKVTGFEGWMAIILFVLIVIGISALFAKKGVGKGVWILFAAAVVSLIVAWGFGGFTVKGLSLTRGSMEKIAQSDEVQAAAGSVKKGVDTVNDLSNKVKDAFNKTNPYSVLPTSAPTVAPAATAVPDNPYSTVVPGPVDPPAQPTAASSGSCPRCQDVINAFSSVYGGSYWGQISSRHLEWLVNSRGADFCVAARGHGANTVEAAKALLPTAVQNRLSWPSTAAAAPAATATAAPPSPTPGPSPTPVPDLDAELRSKLSGMWEAGDRVGAKNLCENARYSGTATAAQTLADLKTVEDKLQNLRSLLGSDCTDTSLPATGTEVANRFPKGETYQVMSVSKKGRTPDGELWTVKVISKGWMNGEVICRVSGRVLVNLGGDPARREGYTFTIAP